MIKIRNLESSLPTGKQKSITIVMNEAAIDRRTNIGDHVQNLRRQTIAYDTSRAPIPNEIEENNTRMIITRYP